MPSIPLLDATVSVRINCVAPLGCTDIPYSTKPLTSQFSMRNTPPLVKLMPLPVLSPMPLMVSPRSLTTSPGPGSDRNAVPRGRGNSGLNALLIDDADRWCDEAGIPKGYSAHGLRKYAAVVRAELGATVPELMAWFGWMTMREAERYIRDAERRKLTISLGRKVNPKLSTPAQG
jgi:hypothetical protein